ncbi:glycosyltransferase family 4 protein [Candidatus Roizmanbacteria bacterium]|nr:glycosyltransferase family 4 protein [Candidatus Roizmanbacteria bacterium]
MKVLFINHLPGLAGAERVLLDLLIEFQKKYKMTFRVVVPAKGDFSSALEKLSIEYVVIPYGWWAGSLHDYERESPATYEINQKAVWDIKKEIESYKPDLVYSNTMVNPWGAFACAMTGTKHIWGIHEFGERDHRLVFHLGLPLTLKLIDAFSDAVITNSLAVKRSVENYISPEKLHQYYYSMEVTRVHPNSKEHFFDKPNALKLLTLGTILPSKGQLDVVKALALLQNRDIQLAIVGAPSDEKYLEKIRHYIARYKLKNKVIIHQFTQNPMQAILQSDMFILSSYCEAFGRVVLENMLLGKMVIGTNTGGTPEMIITGKTGFLYTPGDVKQLANLIAYCDDNRAKIAQFGKNAQYWVKTTFTKQRYYGNIYKTFCQVIESPPQSRKPESFFELLAMGVLETRKKRKSRDKVMEKIHQLNNELHMLQASGVISTGVANKMRKELREITSDLLVD